MKLTKHIWNQEEGVKGEAHHKSECDECDVLCDKRCGNSGYQSNYVGNNYCWKPSICVREPPEYQHARDCTKKEGSLGERRNPGIVANPVKVCCNGLVIVFYVILPAMCTPSDRPT